MAVDVDLELFAGGLASPVDIASAGDDRLFVVEQAGRIRIVESDGTVLGTPFLDIDALVASGGERGLLGLAFHPEYASNGFFYVYYTDNAGDTVVARYTVSGNPDVANAGSALVLLQVAQPFANHNGGDLSFSPTDPCSSCLYIGLGDGGNGCDPNDDAQDPLELLGKMLRLDVDLAAPHVPPDNPFVGDASTRDEIWALGLRNPWRFSFDALTGDLFIGDVGQGAWEEIDFQAASSPGGENYGWDCFEGAHPSGCTTVWTCPGSTPPVREYSHAGARCSVTGGFVYRGSAFPALVGRYFYGDYCTGDIWTLTPAGGGGWTNVHHGAFGGGLTTFGEASDGELYAARGSSIYRIVDNDVSVTTTTATTLTTTTTLVPIPAVSVPASAVLGALLALALGLPARRRR
jgi:glucose/arabinose dehydrogenase